MNQPIQFARFESTGGYVLHKVMVNGRKYSAWFDKSGKLLDAERFSKDNRTTFHVPLDRHRLVAAELTKVGARYLNAK